LLEQAQQARHIVDVLPSRHRKQPDIELFSSDCVGKFKLSGIGRCQDDRLSNRMFGSALINWTYRSGQEIWVPPPQAARR
jgi:hypothetical protein